MVETRWSGGGGSRLFTADDFEIVSEWVQLEELVRLGDRKRSYGSTVTHRVL